jgi:hypothetical protein
VYGKPKLKPTTIPTTHASATMNARPRNNPTFFSVVILILLFEHEPNFCEKLELGKYRDSVHPGR